MRKELLNSLPSWKAKKLQRVEQKEKEYKQSPECKDKQKEYRENPKNKARQKEYYKKKSQAK